MFCGHLRGFRVLVKPSWHTPNRKLPRACVVKISPLKCSTIMPALCPSCVS